MNICDNIFKYSILKNVVFLTSPKEEYDLWTKHDGSLSISAAEDLIVPVEVHLWGSNSGESNIGFQLEKTKKMLLVLYFS